MDFDALYQNPPDKRESLCQSPGMKTDPPELEHLAFEIQLAEYDDDESGDDDEKRRRFKMLGYTGATVRRAYGAAVFDLTGLDMKKKMPILLEHDTSQIVGYGRGMVTPEGLEVEGTIVTSLECGRKVAELSDAGFPWEASIGVAVMNWEDVPKGESVEVNNRTVEGPISVARSCRMLEVSFVTAGADKFTHAVALSAAQQKEREMSATGREELAAFLGKFPGNEGLAARRFAEGKTETEVALELAQIDRQELEAARRELEELRAAKAELEAEKRGLAELQVAAGEPGIGFAGGTSEELASDPADFARSFEPLTADQAWESSAELRAAYLNSRKGFDAHVRREGLAASVEGF